MIKLNTQVLINKLEKQFIKTSLPKLKIGDHVKIGVKIIEGNKERIQYFAGIIIAIGNTSINKVITVRKIIQGIGIERIFLINSKKIQSINILKRSKIRRAKLYYLRSLKGKASRLKQIF